MGDKVVRLLPNNALAVGLIDLAARVRAFGDRLEAGEFGAVERVCIVFESDAGVSRRTYGRPTTNMELVGLLEYAQHDVLNPQKNED